MLKRIALFCLCFFLAAPAYADNDKYVEPTFNNLLHALLRFNALSLAEDNNLLDEYVAITDCDLYKYYFKDDFKWDQIRALVRKSVIKDLSTYPARFYVDVKFRMDRYDFTDQLYRFSKRNTINSINVISLLEYNGPVCGDLYALYLPLIYQVKLDPPITLTGLHMDPKAAEAMLYYMDASGNTEHIVYARFNITVVYIEPLRKTVTGRGGHNKDYSYYQTGNKSHSVIMDSRIDAILFYDDPEMTKLVYTYKPPVM